MTIRPQLLKDGHWPDIELAVRMIGARSWRVYGDALRVETNGGVLTAERHIAALETAASWMDAGKQPLARKWPMLASRMRALAREGRKAIGATYGTKIPHEAGKPGYEYTPSPEAPDAVPRDDHHEEDMTMAKTKKDKTDMVTFAFRLPKKESEAIHKAAGPQMASRWARALLVAAARGDTSEVKKIIEQGVSKEEAA